nr:MAG TPA: hypothetical protein [Bacteriophage sp.]
MLLFHFLLTPFFLCFSLTSFLISNNFKKIPLLLWSS